MFFFSSLVTQQHTAHIYIYTADIFDTQPEPRRAIRSYHNVQHHSRRVYRNLVGIVPSSSSDTGGFSQYRPPPCRRENGILWFFVIQFFLSFFFTIIYSSSSFLFITICKAYGRSTTDVPFLHPSHPFILFSLSLSLSLLLFFPTVNSQHKAQSFLSSSSSSVLASQRSQQPSTSRFSLFPLCLVVCLAAPFDTHQLAFSVSMSIEACKVYSSSHFLLLFFCYYPTHSPHNFDVNLSKPSVPSPLISIFI